MAGRGISIPPDSNSEYRRRQDALIEQDIQRGEEDIAFRQREQATAQAEKTAAWNQMMSQLNDPGSRLPDEPR
ncbi:hypothetical protein [Streptomyces sp. NPDC048825]|uniref:hypothetical protein n=1 Tax=Streptomyces sp. NPDC048825 TaxID=3365592 RepID=UPI00370FA50C